MADHYIKKCKCGKVIAQCRCPKFGGNFRVEEGVCFDCLSAKAKAERQGGEGS